MEQGQTAAGLAETEERHTCSSCSVAEFCSESVFASAPTPCRDACSSSILSCSSPGSFTGTTRNLSIEHHLYQKPSLPALSPSYATPTYWRNTEQAVALSGRHATARSLSPQQRVAHMQMRTHVHMRAAQESRRRGVKQHAFSLFRDLRCCTRSACTSLGFALDPFFGAASLADPSLQVHHPLTQWPQCMLRECVPRRLGPRT